MYRPKVPHIPRYGFRVVEKDLVTNQSLNATRMCEYVWVCVCMYVCTYTTPFLYLKEFKTCVKILFRTLKTL